MTVIGGLEVVAWVTFLAGVATMLVRGVLMRAPALAPGALRRTRQGMAEERRN